MTVCHLCFDVFYEKNKLSVIFIGYSTPLSKKVTLLFFFFRIFAANGIYSMKIRVTYLFVFISILTALSLLPKTGGYIWQPELINPLSAMLFTLLVYLIGRIAKSTESPMGIICTALFILFFCPDSQDFFNRDETAIMQLSSVCIVPFFISQYTRISTKDFKFVYLLMLLMGIFCSYTHNSITIPLCASFLTLSFLQRNRLFRLACWPMVIGFVIGTTLAILRSAYWDPSSWSDFTALSSTTANGFIQLWNTKVFIFAILLTIYFISSREGRKRIWLIQREHRLLTYCLLYSFCAVPFAPLGIDNAIDGVCFFCMFWSLFLFQELLSMLHERHRKMLRK